MRIFLSSLNSPSRISTFTALQILFNYTVPEISSRRSRGFHVATVDADNCNIALFHYRMKKLLHLQMLVAGKPWR